MKKFIYLASIALLSCGIGMAQSTDSNAQNTSPAQSSQGVKSTPPGDSRDQNGNTVAPDGTDTPRGTNSPGAAQSGSQPSSMSSPSSQNSQGTASTPPGDRRDRNGNTVAPDGSVTPKGTNSPGASSDSQPSSASPQTTSPDAK